MERSPCIVASAFAGTRSLSGRRMTCVSSKRLSRQHCPLIPSPPYPCGVAAMTCKVTSRSRTAKKGKPVTQRASSLLMRNAADKAGNKDWFRIQNKADASDTTEVYIYDEIGFWGTTASDFVQQLAQITTDKIDLHLNSPGGEIFDGVAIYQSLKGHPATVNVYIDSLAASAASFIAQAGDNVFIGRNATMMIHDG